jgi:PTS system mannose-specific IIA component
MVTTLILTHGELGHHLLESAEAILGELSGFRAVALAWDDNLEQATEKAQQALDGLNPSDEVLILTDIFGSTPYNVAASFHRPGKVEVITGVNLPMVVRLGCPGVMEMQVSDLAPWIQGKAKGSICLAGEAHDSSKEVRKRPSGVAKVDG